MVHYVQQAFLHAKKPQSSASAVSAGHLHKLYLVLVYYNKNALYRQYLIDTVDISSS